MYFPARSLPALFAVAVLTASCGAESSNASNPAAGAGSDAAAPATPAAPATSDAAILAASQDTPEAFVRALFSIYSDPATASGRDNTGFYSVRTAALRDEAIALNGFFDFDPILSAQDWDDLSVRSVIATPDGADRAGVAVVVRNFGVDSARRFSLVREAGGWRIDDIATDETPSLVAFIEAANARDRASTGA